MFDAMSPPILISDLSLSRTPDVATDPPSDMDLQRANGCGRIVLSGSENGTRIEDIFERFPIRILFPRTGDGAIKEAVLINTAGGVAGGDRLECSVTALPGASLAVTSQAAEKVYRALRETATVVTRLKAGESAKLAWLPQETIVSIERVCTGRRKSNLSRERSCLPSRGLCWVVLHMARWWSAGK